MDESDSFQCLGHSNWTICSLLSQFCSEFFKLLTLMPQSPFSLFPRKMRKGNSPNSKIGWYRGVSVPGAFKLDHLHPVKPILFSKFYNFFTFILGANSYYPRGLIMRKANSPNSRNGQDRGVSVPGAFKLDHFHPVKPILFPNFTTFSLSYWRPILITPEG